MSEFRKKNNMPCAACKLQRRRCTDDCIFLPYFHPSHPERFIAVHRVFGASNVTKMLQELPADNRANAVMSMVYEATARLRDPVYGCVGIISVLQNRVFQLQSELAEAVALTTQLYNGLSSTILYSPAHPHTEVSNSLQATQVLDHEHYICLPEK